MIKLLEIRSCIHIWRFTFFLTKWQTMSLGNNFSSLVPPWPYMKKWKNWKLIQFRTKRNHGSRDYVRLDWFRLGWVKSDDLLWTSLDDHQWSQYDHNWIKITTFLLPVPPRGLADTACVPKEYACLEAMGHEILVTNLGSTLELLVLDTTTYVPCRERSLVLSKSISKWQPKDYYTALGMR